MNILEINDNVSSIKTDKKSLYELKSQKGNIQTNEHHEKGYETRNLRMLKNNCYNDKINVGNRNMRNLEKTSFVENDFRHEKLERLKAFQERFIELHPRNELFIEHFNDYISEIERLTETKIPKFQKRKILEYVKENPLQHLTKDERNQVKKQYNLKRSKMIKEWELNTGKKWPYSNEKLKNEHGRLLSNKSVRHQLHHIILISYGGPNVWWNSHPAENDAHVKIHAKKSVSKRIFENKKDVK